jgi:TM2 domain-containing membrane protein YozV
MDRSLVPYGEKRIPAAALAILVGGLGIHKMFLGYWVQGLTVLALTVFFSAIGWFIVPFLLWMLGLLEGVLYLMRSNSSFYHRYQVQRRPWL